MHCKQGSGRKHCFEAAPSCHHRIIRGTSDITCGWFPAWLRDRRCLRAAGFLERQFFRRTEVHFVATAMMLASLIGLAGIFNLGIFDALAATSLLSARLVIPNTPLILAQANQSNTSATCTAGCSAQFNSCEGSTPSGTTILPTLTTAGVTNDPRQCMQNCSVQLQTCQQNCAFH
jgi:hypothetical protein